MNSRSTWSGSKATEKPCPEKQTNKQKDEDSHVVPEVFLFFGLKVLTQEGPEKCVFLTSAGTKAWLSTQGPGTVSEPYR